MFWTCSFTAMSYDLSSPLNSLVGFFGKAGQRVRRLAEEAPPAGLLGKNLLIENREFEDSVAGVLRFADQAGHGIEQLLQIGYRQEEERLKLKSIRGERDAPGPLLVEAIKALPLRKKLDLAVDILRHARIARKLSEVIEIGHDPVITGQRDDGDGLMRGISSGIVVFGGTMHCPSGNQSPGPTRVGLVVSLLFSPRGGELEGRRQVKECRNVRFLPLIPLEPVLGFRFSRRYGLRKPENPRKPSTGEIQILGYAMSCA